MLIGGRPRALSRRRGQQVLLEEISSASHSPGCRKAWDPYRNPTAEPGASTNCYTSEKCHHRRLSVADKVSHDGFGCVPRRMPVHIHTPRQAVVELTRRRGGCRSGERRATRAATQPPHVLPGAPPLW